MADNRVQIVVSRAAVKKKQTSQDYHYQTPSIEV